MKYDTGFNTIVAMSTTAPLLIGGMAVDVSGGFGERGARWTEGPRSSWQVWGACCGVGTRGVTRTHQHPNGCRGCEQDWEQPLTAEEHVRNDPGQ